MKKHSGIFMMNVYDKCPCGQKDYKWQELTLNDRRHKCSRCGKIKRYKHWEIGTVNNYGRDWNTNPP